MFSQGRQKFTNKCFSTKTEHVNPSQYLACHSVCVSTMAKKLSLQEVLIILLIKKIARKRQLKMNLTVKACCKIYQKRKTSLNKLQTLQQLKRSDFLIVRAQQKLI